MKRLWLIGALAVLLTTTLEAQERRATSGKPAPKKPATQPAVKANAATGAASSVSPKTQELASYAIGYDFATRLRNEGAVINFQALVTGLKDSFAGEKPAHAQPDLKAAVEAFDQDVQARAQARLEQIAAKNQREGQAYLAKNKAKKGVKALPNGVQYEVIKAGKGKKPSADDAIRAHYHGTLIDGTVFDTTQGGEPVQIAVQETIPGWAEVLPQMKVGDKWRLTVPPELAYGAQGFGPVPPSATLIFEIELLDVVRPEAKQSARPRELK